MNIGTIAFGGNIESTSQESKEIFTGVGNNPITIGSSTGQVVIGYDLVVNNNILADTTENKEIFTNVGSNDVTIGSAFGSVVIGRDLKVNRHIVADQDENKEIFTNVVGGNNSSITIGGSAGATKSKIIVGGNLQPNHDIQSGNQDVAKNIFTDVSTKTIKIGGAGGTVETGNHLLVNGNIIGTNSNTDLLKEISTGNTLTIAGSGSTTTFGGHIRVTMILNHLQVLTKIYLPM